MILKLIVPAALLGMVVLYGAWLYKSVRDLVPKIKSKISCRREFHKKDIDEDIH